MSTHIKTLPPMTRAEWEALPAIVRRFVTWEDARQGKVIELPDPEKLSAAVEYFTRQWRDNRTASRMASPNQASRGDVKP